MIPSGMFSLGEWTTDRGYLRREDGDRGMFLSQADSEGIFLNPYPF